MGELHRSEDFTVTIEGDLVRVKRSEKPFPTTTVVGDESAEMLRAFKTIDPKAHAILIDMRDVPMRNDPEFEGASREIRNYMVAFKKHALLLKTAVGQLQLTRLGRQDGRAAPNMFSDEAEAIAFLAS